MEPLSINFLSMEILRVHLRRQKKTGKTAYIA